MREQVGIFTWLHTAGMWTRWCAHSVVRTYNDIQQIYLEDIVFVCGQLNFDNNQNNCLVMERNGRRCVWNAYPNMLNGNFIAVNFQWRKTFFVRLFCEWFVWFRESKLLQIRSRIYPACVCVLYKKLFLIGNKSLFANMYVEWWCVQ